MTRGYQQENTVVHQIIYHFIWISKRQKEVLVGRIRQRLIDLVHKKLDDLDCKIIILDVKSNYVHLCITADPRISPNYLIGQIKGYTSRIMRLEFRELLYLPSLWTRDYWVSTEGIVSPAVIKRYIEAQLHAKNQHH